MSAPGTASSSRVRFLVLLGTILFLALVVRLPQIGVAGLWNDEAIVAAVAEHPVEVLLEDVRGDAHPPLFFVIAHLVRMAVGFEGWTEAGIRAISLFFGMVSIAVIYKVGQQMISDRAGVLAAFLLALSPMHVHYSREGRNYALLMLLILLAMSGVAALHRRPRQRPHRMGPAALGEPVSVPGSVVTGGNDPRRAAPGPEFHL